METLTHILETADQTIKTQWTDNKRESVMLAFEMRKAGAELVKVFQQPGSCLGKIRIVGFFKK